tara:strand:- start:1784 stop:2038 length:255 start_codon:yes stop_codon:yes gene_type:complete
MTTKNNQIIEEYNVITFDDYYQFKEVSKKEAESLIGVCYGIDLSTQTEALIESVEDLENFEIFGTELVVNSRADLYALLMEDED